MNWATIFYRLFFILLYICAADGIEPATLTLIDNSAAAIYRGIPWTVNANNPVGKIAFKFETLSTSGNVFTARLYDAGNEYLKVSVFVDEENHEPKLHVDYYVNADDNNLLSTVFPGDDPVEGEIEINLKHQTITVTNPSGEFSDLSFGDLSAKTLSLDLTVGAAEGRNSIVGCASVLNISLSDSVVDLFSHKYSIISGQINDGCQKCGDHSCHLGQCRLINDQPKCDCRGTAKVGLECNQDAPSVHFNRKNYLAYNLPQDKPISVIEFSFKVLKLNGVLMYGSLSQNIGRILLVINGRTISLILGNTTFTITDVDINSQRFHHVRLDLDRVLLKIGVNVNGRTTSTELVKGSTADDLRLKSPLMFGGEVTQTGITGCLREIYVEDVDLLTAYENKNPDVTSNEPLNRCPSDKNHRIDDSKPLEGVVEQNCDSEGRCQNAEHCQFDGDKLICSCKKGFTGRQCQFSTLPRNCYDIWESGTKANGTYLVDLDGSGRLEATEVFCMNGVTVVTHNVPEQTTLKSSQNLRAKITYRLFSKEHQQFLRDNSLNCDQLFTYQCDSAPLNFAQKQTWFTSLDGKVFTNFIDELSTCKNGRCKCDTEKSAVDEGFFPKNYIPIASIHSVGCPNCNGRVTLGPLSCNGTNGRTKAYMVTFTEEDASLALDYWKWKSLSFEFRTYMQQQFTLISMHDNHNTLELSVDGNTVKFNIPTETLPDIAAVTAVHSLNDGQWHRIIFELYEDEIRLSVDDITVVTESKALLNEDSVLLKAGGSKGFLGCIRRLKIDGGLINFEQLFAKSGDQEGVELGCENQCAFQQCQNGGKCIEDFKTRQAYCKCKNPYTDSGASCEISVNLDSDISLLDESYGTLKLLSEGREAVTSDYIFSFRTNRPDGMLLFVHDTLNNFIQVHLSDRINLMLTLNIGINVFRCTVTANAGEEYSRMKWIQVMILQQQQKIILDVDGNRCTIDGPRTLTTTVETAFNLQGPMEDVVKPPSSAFGVASNITQSLTLIGGFPSRTDNSGIYVIAPKYDSIVVNFVGCIRGFVAGTQQVNLRDKSLWIQPSTAGHIRVGCNANCDQLEAKCLNKGSCNPQWHEGTAKCDCSRTSYSGYTCEEDIGAAFNGNTALLVNFDSPSISFENLPSADHILSFAFANSNTNAPKVLAIVIFKNKDQLHITQLQDGSISVATQRNGNNYAETFPSDLTAEHRNFLYARRNRTGSLIVTVNSVRKAFPNGAVESFAEAEKFLFAGIPYQEGGTLPDITVEQNSVSNYTGCMSNIEIDLGDEKFKFTPIQYIKTAAQPSTESFITAHGEPLSFQGCGYFPGLEPLLGIQPIIPSKWEVPLELDTFIVPTPKSVASDITKKPSGDVGHSSSVWIVVIIMLVILLILILIIIMYLRYRRRKATSTGANKRNPSLSGTPDKDTRLPIQSESIPLVPAPTLTAANEDPATPTSPSKIRSDFNVPEADTQLNPDAPLSYPKVSMSSILTYYTAKETLDNEQLSNTSESQQSSNASQAGDYLDDLEHTLRDYDEDTLTEFGHNNSRPQRMSSFRNDPTAPTDSPLYRKRQSRSPKPVISPSSPL